jgi:intein/homing endonuclease
MIKYNTKSEIITDAGFIKPKIVFFGAKKHWQFGDGNLGVEVLRPTGQWVDDVEQLTLEVQNQYCETMHCFPYNTKILMEDLTEKNICEVKVGDYVITHTGQKKKVLNISARKYDGYFIDLKFKGLYRNLISTTEHPILTARGWIKAEDITTNDYAIVQSCDKLIKDSSIYEVEKDPDFLWFLGLFLAEGNLGKEPKKIRDGNKNLKVRGQGNGEGNIQFSLCNDEVDYAVRIIDIAKRLFGVKFNVYYRKNSKTMTVVGYNTYLRNLLKELCGEYCDGKIINKRLMFIEPKLQLNILKGWLDGDGCYKVKARSYVGTSTSEELIKQMFLICLRNNIKATTMLFTASKKNIGRKPAWSLGIYGEEINKVLDTDYKWSGCSPKMEVFEDGKLNKKITEIKKKKIANYGVVYNLEVEDDNSYIANSICVHNCWIWNTLKALCVLMFVKYGTKEDFSERFNGVLGGATTNGGSPQAGCESVRKDGVINQSVLPWTEDLNTFWKFSSPRPMTKALIDLGHQWLLNYDFSHDWVECPSFYAKIRKVVSSVLGLNLGATTQQKMMEALMSSPLGVAVFAWQTDGDGLCFRYPGQAENHWTMIVGYVENQYWIVYDSYRNCWRKLRWNYGFRYVKRYTINKTDYAITESRRIVNELFLQDVKGSEPAIYYIAEGKKHIYINKDNYDKVHDKFGMPKTFTVVNQEALNLIPDGEAMDYERLKDIKPFLLEPLINN